MTDDRWRHKPFTLMVGRTVTHVHELDDGVPYLRSECGLNLWRCDRRDREQLRLCKSCAAQLDFDRSRGLHCTDVAWDPAWSDGPPPPPPEPEPIPDSTIVPGGYAPYEPIILALQRLNRRLEAYLGERAEVDVDGIDWEAWYRLT